MENTEAYEVQKLEEENKLLNNCPQNIEWNIETSMLSEIIWKEAIASLPEALRMIPLE